MRALSIAATGMAAQQTNVDVISNNIANMNTIGYKRQEANFEDLLYEDVKRPGAQSSDTGTVIPTGIQLGAGVETGSVYRITSQGVMTNTGNQLDVAINGSGYFQVLLPSGETAYTRAGNFSLSPNGVLVTSDGYTVLPQTTIPSTATQVSISASGLIQVTLPGQVPTSQVGQLQLANFANPAGLEAMGSNLFLQSGASGAPVTGTPTATSFGSIQQGFTEASNVDSVTEISNLIIAQRAYEMNSKVVTTADQMLQSTNTMKS
jgi:flagellar basal-body rod protein FlgG